MGLAQRCGLGAEEIHQNGPGVQQVLGTATEKTAPGSVSKVWANAEARVSADGCQARPMDANELG